MKTKREKSDLFLMNYPVWEIMTEAEASASVAIETLERENRLPYCDDLRDCAEKYLADDATETEFVSETGTRKPSTRAERRKATAKAKRRLAEIYNHPFHNDSVRAVVRNGNEVAYVKEGDTWSWRKEWRRMNHRIRRHEGKRECYEYAPEEAMEMEIESEIGEPKAIAPTDLYNAAYEFMMEKDLLNEFFDYLYKRY